MTVLKIITGIFVVILAVIGSADLTAMHYQNPVSAERTRWTSHVIEWQAFNGVRMPILVDL